MNDTNPTPRHAAPRAPLAERLAVKAGRVQRARRRASLQRAAFRADQRDAAGFGYLIRQGR
jgi:hypothetical protein